MTRINSRRKWPIAALGVIVGAAIGGVSLLSTALAVHDEPTPFEIDGDPNRNTADDDWDSVFSLPAPYPSPRGTPTEAGTATFIADAADLPGGKEASAWEGSNKDIYLVEDWAYKAAKVTPDKNNITNAYAKAYTVEGFPASDFPGHPAESHSHLVIYFGADRYADDGDAAMGFWFFRDNVATDGQGGFTGSHQVGDVLIQVDFRGQGDNEVEVFTWVGTGGNAGGGTLNRIVQGLSTNTTVCTSNDTACATTNVGEVQSPWSYSGKKSGGDPAPADTFPARVFIEGGVDVGALFGQVCFSSFMAETRSSHSETAELKDFALDDFDLCSIDLVDKECSNPSYNYVNNDYTTTHTVEITNDGFGPLYDVSIRDVPGAVVCDITAISGGSGHPSLPLEVTNDWMEVANGLAPGEDLTVTMVCITSVNPFVNTVEVRAGSSPGDTGITDTPIQESGDDVEACSLTLTPVLTLTKHCKGDENSPLYTEGDLSVTLEGTDYAPRVCVDITVTNFVDTGATPQRITVSSFTDTEQAVDTPTGATVSIMSAFLAANGGSAILDPNETVSFERCYDPAAPDYGETNPGLVAYTDKVRVDGSGQASGTAFAEASATCRLCPTCPDCPTP